MNIAGLHRRFGRDATVLVWAPLLLMLTGISMGQTPSPSPPPVPRAASEPLPPPRAPGPSTYRIPLKGQPAADHVQGTARNGRVSLIARDATLGDVLATLAQMQGTNIVCAGQNDSTVTVTLNDLPFDQALDAVVAMAGCTWTRRGPVIYVTRLSAGEKIAPGVQGRKIRVIPLDFLSATDVETGIKTLLSPVGSSYVLSRSPEDNRKTVESIVVEDVPQYLDRITQYIKEVDQPPRQVLIEVHVLQVELEEGCRHGVNFSHLMNISGHTLNLRVQGFASDSSPQAFLAELTAPNLTGLLEALRTTTDAKTLASPKVLALNGQKAQIQVGEKLGYRVLTTTQTSTLEDVQFLDVGVILEVTPTISHDNQILMNIHPKVSTGQISNDTGLPEEKTSEVTTDVLLSNGEGIVIGGLIQEEDSDLQSKLIFFGDLYLIGPLFQRRTRTKVRKETIFFLLPRIVEPGVVTDPDEIDRAQTRLFHGPLCQNPRPWEPPLTNCYNNPADLNPLHHLHRPQRQNKLQVVDEHTAPVLEVPRVSSGVPDEAQLPTPAIISTPEKAVTQAAYIEENAVLRRLPPIDQ